MSCQHCGTNCFGNICRYCKGEEPRPASAPVKSKWVLDSKDPDRVYIKLTEHHELCINFTGEGIILDNVDQRKGDVVDTRCLDLEDLNCCMDPDEV